MRCLATGWDGDAQASSEETRQSSAVWQRAGDFVHLLVSIQIMLKLARSGAKSTDPRSTSGACSNERTQGSREHGHDGLNHCCSCCQVFVVSAAKVPSRQTPT
jgi:hypothetical protein